MIALAAEGVQILVKTTRQFTAQPFDCSGGLGLAFLPAHVATLGSRLSSEIHVSYVRAISVPGLRRRRDPPR